MLVNFRQPHFARRLLGRGKENLDSYIYGFALRETSLPVATDDESDYFTAPMVEQMGEVYPYLAELRVPAGPSRTAVPDQRVRVPIPSHGSTRIVTLLIEPATDVVGNGDGR